MDTSNSLARSGPLSGYERRVLGALCDTLLPPGGAIPPGAAELEIAGDIEALLRRLRGQPRWLVRAMLLGFDLTALLSRRPSLFHRLDADHRYQWVEASRSSRFRPRREALSGLDVLIQLAYASHPQVASLIGYDGQPLVALGPAGSATGPPPPVDLPVITYPAVRDATIVADVVVVGSGAGGAVAADTLARAGLDVVVLEEGPPIHRSDITGHRPVERLFELYRDGGLTFTLGNPVISLPMGRAVGGTTVVNSGTCFRTPDAILASWAASGIPGVAPEAMAPWFEAVEEMLGVQPVPEDVLGANGETMRRGAEELGLSGGPIRRNIRGCHGHGVCAFGCPVDAKQAMHLNYLPRAVAAGARVYSGTRVRKIRLDAGRAAGVVADVLDPETGRRRGTLEVDARATVLAAGAIFTPALLARQRLARSSRQLGHNLVIHPGAGTTARFDEPLRAWRGTMQSYYVDEKLSDGVLLEATFPPPGLGYSAGSLPGWGRDKSLFALYPHMASCGSIIGDAGVGRVSPLGRNGVAIRYDLTQRDAAKVVEGIAMAAEIFFAAGATEVYPMLPGLDAIHSAAEVRLVREGRWRPSDLHLSAYHPMGSARMGADPSSSVVDPFGRVWDVPDLFVFDASVLPSSCHVNPQMTVMALVARMAARLADSLS
ncbi:MAG: GMC family oxidoreductase [Acidimicrobiales bacterium]